MPLLQRIAENKQCSEATALMIFWRAQPDEFTIYKWEAKNIAGDPEIFPEVLAYNPSADKNIKMKSPRRYWKIPEGMQQKIG